MSEKPEYTEEVWTYLGERRDASGKSMDAWRPEDSDEVWFHRPKKSKAPAHRVGSVCTVTVIRGAAATSYVAGGEKGPKFLRMAEDAPSLNVAAAAARAVWESAALQKRQQAEGSGLGPVQLSEVRRQLAVRFGHARTAYLATVLEYLTR